MFIPCMHLTGQRGQRKQPLAYLQEYGMPKVAAPNLLFCCHAEPLHSLRCVFMPSLPPWLRAPCCPDPLSSHAHPLQSFPQHSSVLPFPFSDGCLESLKHASRHAYVLSAPFQSCWHSLCSLPACSHAFHFPWPSSSLSSSHALPSAFP